jgi:type II secretory pathway pseudopilin PulG
MLMSRNRQQSGFTLIEVLTVAGIIMVLGGITVLAWGAYYPIFALDQAAQQIASDLNMAAFQAVNTQNNWMVVFIYRFTPQHDTQPVNIAAPFYPNLIDDGNTFSFWKNSYLIINDDGWLGFPPRVYELLSPRFDILRRNNGRFGINELVRGPVKVPGRGIKLRNAISFERPNEVLSPRVIHFEPDWTVRAVRRTRTEELGRIWITDSHYRMGTSTADIDYGDMIRHRRMITVRSHGPAEVSYGEGRTL